MFYCLPQQMCIFLSCAQIQFYCVGVHAHNNSAILSNNSCTRPEASSTTVASRVRAINAAAAPQQTTRFWGWGWGGRPSGLVLLGVLSPAGICARTLAEQKHIRACTHTHPSTDCQQNSDARRPPAKPLGLSRSAHTHTHVCGKLPPGARVRDALKRLICCTLKA